MRCDIPSRKDLGNISLFQAINMQINNSLKPRPQQDIDQIEVRIKTRNPSLLHDPDILIVDSDTKQDSNCIKTVFNQGFDHILSSALSNYLKQSNG